MDELRLKALAKVNIGLDVLRKREDGYHEVRMIMQTIHLFDKLRIKKTKEPGIKINSNLYYLPVNENNLIHKAAKLMMEEFSIQEGIEVFLEKHIPVAAGMAGGSTDAAATLYGLNRMFDLGLSMKSLKEYGVRIGADVPYCLMRGTALAEGIGEKLTPLAPMPKCPVLVAKPGIAVSTKFVYENLRLDKQTQHPDIDRLIENIEDKNLGKIARDMGNILETVTIKHYPEIADLKKIILGTGALNALMSGSGPTVFGLYENEKTAKKAYKIVRKSGLAKQLYLTTIYNNRK
ncbi:MAG: 4-(cytidine 5'-diphospho)-2-C-methyl-D-erythritol kinase [Lachnospiraceae bacterium]|nr:4-(cytidine 5'-diphospho)-2-C-methyl-D-erythritol kinase [Lachnospiraceae bacterium]